MAKKKPIVEYGVELPYGSLEYGRLRRFWRRHKEGVIGFGAGAVLVLASVGGTVIYEKIIEKEKQPVKYRTVTFDKQTFIDSYNAWDQENSSYLMDYLQFLELTDGNAANGELLDNNHLRVPDQNVTGYVDFNIMTPEEQNIERTLDTSYSFAIAFEKILELS